MQQRCAHNTLSQLQNKKQRMMVRAAVLKMKDPRQIIRDMEKLDEMGEDARMCFNSVYFQDEVADTQLAFAFYFS